MRKKKKKDYSIELLFEIANRLKETESNLEKNCLIHLGQSVAEGLVDNGISTEKFPNIFQEVHKSELKGKYSIGSLNKGIKELGGVDRYVDYTLDYIKRQSPVAM